MIRNLNLSYSQLGKYALIAVVLLLILFVNYKNFIKHTDSNPQKITDYEIPEEYVERTRPLVVAGLFYPASIEEAKARYENFIGNTSKEAPLSSRPEIFIIPHAGYQYSQAVAQTAYQSLKPYSKSIKNVIFVAPAHHANFKGAGLLKQGELANIPINAKISEVLSEKKSLRYHTKAFAKENLLTEQLKNLPKVLDKFSLVPILYSDIKPKDLAEALTPYAQQQDTVVIFSADLSNYFSDVQNPLSESADEHQNCGKIGIETAVLMAKELNLTPKTIDLVNAEHEMKQFNKYSGYELDIETQTRDKSILREQKSLEDFKTLYGAKLLQIARVSVEDMLLHEHEYKPSRKDYDDILFNKGACYVRITDKDGNHQENGSIIAGQGIALNVAENARLALAKFPQPLPLSSKDLKISILLITGFEQVKYKDEKDLLEKLNTGTDGVILRSGNRQAIFLPSKWQNYKTKQDFLNDLKFTAGLNPSYWSNQIKIYKFYTVEITENEN